MGKQELEPSRMVSSSLGKRKKKKTLQGRIASAKPLERDREDHERLQGGGGIKVKYSNQINSNRASVKIWCLKVNKGNQLTIKEIYYT